KFESANSYRSTIQNTQTQAQTLSQQWDELSNKGGGERQRILNIRSMLQYRDMYDQILHDIQKVVPALVGKPEQIKQTPRKARREIKIDSINNAYYPDLSPIGD